MKNRQQRGIIHADSKEEAAAQIKKPGWFITYLKLGSKQDGLASLFSPKIGLGAIERILFTDHLAAMIQSGTPLIEALETYQEEEKPQNAQMIESIIQDSKRGKKLSESMAVFPDTFSPLYLALVRAGELSGSLEETLEYLATDLRREKEFYDQVKSALIYPMVVLFVALIVITILVLFVIPRITQVTQSLGDELPTMTRIVSSVAIFLADFGPILLIATLGLIVVGILLIRNRQTRQKLEPRLLKLPVIGDLIQKYILARFLRVLSGSIKYAIPLTQSLANVGDLVDNVVYQKACQRISKFVSTGGSLSQALSQEGSNLFPNIVVKTIRSGEKTGTLHKSMFRLSKFYEAEVDRDLKRLTDLIEPALVIVLGLIVGTTAISVIAPIYELTGRL